MNPTTTLLSWAVGTMILAGRLGRYLIIFLWTFCQPKAALTARLLALQSQLATCKDRIDRKECRKPKFDPAFRLLWVLISKVVDGWEDLAQLMQPATVKRWHKTAFRAYWRWKSTPGRKPLKKDMRALIRRLSRENPLWSPERIRRTLKLMKIKPPCIDTIAKYMGRPRKPRKPSSSWVTFLRNHIDTSWGIDFFTVTTLQFQTLYVFFVLEHGRRRVRHFAITRGPHMAWIVQQLREATPFGEQPRYLSRDNDKLYGYGVPRFLKSCGIKEVRTAYRSPWQNPFAERFVGTLRRELLDHVIVLNEEHLERLLGEYVEDYYHRARPHKSLDGDTPIPWTQACAETTPAKLIAIPILGGLHHRYVRVAA